MCRTVKRYSTAFKQKVVSEIESGQLSVGDARRLYDFTGGETIQKWIRRFGKDHLLNKVVRIEVKDEKDRILESPQNLSFGLIHTAAHRILAVRNRGYFRFINR